MEKLWEGCLSRRSGRRGIDRLPPPGPSPQGHLAFLRALGERLCLLEGLPRPSQVAALSPLALVEVGRRVKAASLWLPEEPLAALQSLLVGDYASFPEVEENLLARLSAVEKDDTMVRACLDALQDPS